MGSKYLNNHIQITFVTITKLNLCLNCAFNEDVFLRKYGFVSDLSKTKKILISDKNVKLQTHLE